VIILVVPLFGEPVQNNFQDKYTFPQSYFLFTDLKILFYGKKENANGTASKNKSINSL